MLAYQEYIVFAVIGVALVMMARKLYRGLVKQQAECGCGGCGADQASCPTAVEPERIPSKRP